MICMRLLGTADLRASEDEAAEPLAVQQKPQALLAYLALATPRGLQQRDTLLALFWPDLDDAHARNALSKALSHIRSVAGPDALHTRGADEVGLSRTALRCDVWAFEQAVETGDAAAAIRLYRGDLLRGFFAAGVAAEFEEWVAGERTRLRTLAARAAWRLVGEAQADGRTADAVEYARQALALAPHDEAAFRSFLDLCVTVGDRLGALHAYEGFAGRLRAEYGVDPAPETRALVDRLRRETGSPSPDVPAGSAVAAAPRIAPSSVALSTSAGAASAVAASAVP